MNSMWRLVKVNVDGTDYYRIIHNSTGLYVTANGTVVGQSGNDAARLRIHLEAFNTPTDATLFLITEPSGGKVAIRPKDTSYFVDDKCWWDMGNGNKDNYWNNNWEGALGLWNGLSSPAYNWILESTLPTCAMPIITYDESAGSISLSYPIAGDGGVTIYYTTDGSEPTSSSSTYSAAFSATGVKMVRAIAVKDGYDNSAEAKLYSPTQPWLFKTTDDANVSYYMIPPTDDDRTTDLNVTTSNVPNERMQWYLKPAALRTGVQYYYFVNAVTGKYAYCNANENGSNALLMKALGEDDTESDRYMFRIIDYGTYLNIVPKHVARLIPSSSNRNCLRKANATDHTNPIGLYQDDGGLSRWTAIALPDDPKSLFPQPSDMVSSSTNSVYFKLRGATQTDNADYFLTPPTTVQGAATAALDGDNQEWCLLPADDDDTWCTYYYLRNGSTGRYLYFDGTTYNANNNKFFASNEVVTGNEDKYKFLVLKTANTTYSGTYHIVPKSIRNNNNQASIALNRNNSSLRTQNSRGNNNSCWYLDAVSGYVAAPIITYHAADNTVSFSCTTPGTITYYYTTDGSDPTDGSTPYSTAFALPDDCTTVKAIAVKDGVSSKVATYTAIVHASVGDTKRIYYIQSVASTDFYLIPGDTNNGNVRVNTLSLPRPSMQWYFMDAGIENDIQYYYIVNNHADNDESASTLGYLYRNGNDANIKYTLDTSDDNYKFAIETNASGGYNIVAKNLPNNSLQKNDGNHNNATNIIATNGTKTNDRARWNFVTTQPVLTAPVTLSTAENTTYYTISNVGQTGYIAPPTATNVILADTEGNDQSWYFLSAGSDNWVNYYYIVHANTGQYLYFSGTNNNDGFYITQKPFADSDADRYKFAIAPTVTEGQYYIVPQTYRYVYNHQYYCLYKVNNQLQLKTSAYRSDNRSKWTFTSTTFKCATPTFFYDDVNLQFHISCTTPGAKIYYLGYDNADNPPTITLADLTLYTGPFSKEHDYYIAIAARCSDVSDQSDPAYGDPSSARFHYHLIDKSNHEVFSIGSNDETLGLPEAYRSPLVSQYHYYTTNFDTSTNTPKGAEATEVATHIYVTYDVSPLVRLDGTQYYMLRYQNPNNTQLYEEAGDRPKGFPENTQNAVYYPYTNGKEGFNLYGDQKKDAAFDDGENTRTRFLWYFEGEDPYRVKIRSYNTTGTSYHALPGPYPSYFYTFYGNGGSTTTGHTGAAVHTVLTQTDRTNHQPTEYMILNGTGTNTSAFPYRLMTTAASGPNGTHLVVSSIDHQWLNAAHEDSKYSSRITNWYQMPDLGNDFTQYNKNRQTTAGESDPTQGVNLWYETIDLGTDFQIEPLQLMPVLHLVDNHGWEIAHWSMENTEACRNRIKQFNSPLVKEYRWYSGESQTGNNRAITKVAGYYKYYINTARPVATTTDLTSNWMHVNFDDVSQNLNFYVFYDAKDEYGNGNSYLLDLGGKMAEVSGSTISYTANGSDYHVGTELKNGVTPPAAMQWLVAANPDLDAENAYTGTYDYSSDATNTSAGRPEPGKDAGRFDPYSLRIESAATTGNYYTVNGSSYAITLTAGTTAQFTYTDRADLSRQNRGTTFMAVQGTDGKMRLVLRNSDRAESLNRALDSGGTATTTAATTTEAQTAILVPTRRNVYTIVRSDGTQVISSTGYTKTLHVPDDIASPLLDDTYYSFYPTLQDAAAKTNPLTNETFATRYTDPVFVRYDEKAYTNTPIDLSGSTWYNIRNGSQFMTCEEGQPAFTTTTPTDAQLDDDKFFWTFSSGDPYTVTVSSKTTNDAVFDNTFIWLGNSTYGWNLVANTPAVDNQYAYLYNDGEGHAQQHREALGQTTAADNLFVEQYDLKSYTYHIINTAGTEAVKYTTQQRSVTSLNYANLPAAIRSPYIEDETLTFYSDADRTTAITTAAEATGGHIYVKYTTNQLADKRLDLKGASEYQMRVNGTYVYDNAGTLATTGTPTDNWVLTGSDPYAVEIKSKTGEHSIAYDTSGQTLSLSGTNNKFILLGGKSGTLVELMAATGANVANETYYNIGLDNGSFSLYSSTTHQQGNAALQINFSRVTDDDGTVMEIAFSSDMNANLAGRYKAVQGFTIDETINGFTGVFDGDFQEISSTTLPLFAEINNAVVRNVIIREARISSGNNEGDAGAITDVADGASRIYNCGVLGGSVSGSGHVGGLVGTLNGSSRVINCFSYANVRGGTYAAGIVGYNSYLSKNNDLKTMVMNCMFYGNVESGTNISPVYGGEIIDNSGDTGLNNFNYFLADNFTDFVNRVTAYNCALGAEERFLTRFEFYRQILNSNLPLASWYARRTSDNYANEMAKWVLETADRNIAEPKPYPVLHKHGKYPSIINIDAAHAGMAADPEGTDRNKGYRLGTLNVSIGLGTGAPLAARLTTTVKYLNITDKDTLRHNFNYYKVQLPYYNEVGVGNYTDNRVVTGWKITSIEGGTPGSYTTGSDVTLDGEGNVTATPYNFADRNCTQKDLYSVTGRVFSQGAYFDVPNGVTGITIEPVWAKAVYLADPCYDKTYTKDFSNNNGNASDITAMGTRYTNGDNYLINGSSQKVYTTMSNAITALSRPSGSSVYDYAVVLVGNYHHYYGNSSMINDKMGFTIMSADLDFDNEPDNCFLYQHQQRQPVSPIRFDFLCLSGIGMAQKPSNSTRMPGIGIFKPRGWFEVTNTCLAQFYQFEYDWSTKDADQDGSPLILLGGIYEQFVSSNDGAPTHTKYIHLGSNAWFKMFNNGIHADKVNFTPHKPISVTGGDYDLFYLSGMFKPSATVNADNAECYITGGRFGEVAGAGQEQINGDVYWQIDRADIDNFYGGGINAAKPVTGSIDTDIRNSHVTMFCGGPKFGDMIVGKTVNTVAEGCTFVQYFGAGYGGTSYNRVRTRNATNQVNYNFSGWANSDYTRQYYSGNGGIATNYEYELFPYSGFADDNNVGRFYVNYASLSLATTHDVTSTLTGCKITGNFYGGGSLGKVEGNVTSTLTDCTVKGSVYGAGFSATAPTVDVFPKEGFATEPHYDGNSGSYTQGVYPTPVTYTWHQVESVSAGKEFDETNHLIFTTVDMNSLGTVDGDVTLNIAGTTTVAGDVYGGGALASSNTKTGEITTTTVNLKGGTINGSVYGGGMGRLANDNVTAVEAKVGNVHVILNGTPTTETVDGQEVTTYLDNCVVKGNIFGCNNLNGTPRGSVTVEIFKTAGDSRTAQENLKSIDDQKHKYQLAAVYGGGNLAEYLPDDPNNTKTNVIIHGCDLTSIRTVYGGGNAASTPATQVDVYGTYEIEEVFGGGNGKDRISRDGGTTFIDNPGANVGFHAYADDDEHAQTVADRATNFQYGSGQASVNIYGGLIHRVFGGSNTKGNVRVVAVTMLDSKSDCEFQVDEAYGGGKSAPMDGAAQLIMACIPGLKAAYGGAEEADIHNDVILNITNGSFDRIFGGNNVRGTIDGTITVNIEETGCRPVIIGQLYGGGNQAPYEAPFVEGSTTERRPGPTLNVRSFTSIGEVYGGGYGATAVVTGDTHVNINVSEGKYNDWDDNVLEETIREISYTEFRRTTDGDFVLDNDSNRVEDKKTIAVIMPSHAKGAIGAIYNVYGGGNAANVIGNTFVNIGTATDDQQLFATPTDKTEAERTKAVIGADIRGNVYGGGNAADVTGNTNVKIGR